MPGCSCQRVVLVRAASFVLCPIVGFLAEGFGIEGLIAVSVGGGMAAPWLSCLEFYKFKGVTLIRLILLR